MMVLALLAQLALRNIAELSSTIISRTLTVLDTRPLNLGLAGPTGPTNM